MSTHLGLTAGAFRRIIDTPSQAPSSSSLDVIQYLPVDESVPSCKPEGGCELHHDRGLLTLIWSDTVEGLQVKVMLPFLCTSTPATNLFTRSLTTCSPLTMPEYLLHVLVTACKAERCCFYVYIVTIEKLWIC